MFRRILPHVCIVFSLMFLVLLILHAYNPYIGFISGTTSLWCLAVFCIVALLTAVVLVWVDRHNDP